MKYPELMGGLFVSSVLLDSMFVLNTVNEQPTAAAEAQTATECMPQAAAPDVAATSEAAASTAPADDPTAGHVGTINTGPEGDVPADAAITSNEQTNATPATPEANASSITGSDPETLPEGVLGEMIQLGQEIVAETDTHPASQEYVRKMACTSCHLNDGQNPRGGTFIGLASAYPAYAPREKKVITVEDRIANGYMRSISGTRPPIDSDAVVAISAYINWLSEGVPMKMNAKASLGPNAVKQIKLDPETASVENGEMVFTGKCAPCHGADGQDNENIAPLWGDQSYNSGAGMAQNPQLASWVKVSMPLGNSDLTDPEALDVAAYINSHECPKFVLEEHLSKKQ